MLSSNKSQALYARACAVNPGGVNSPIRAFRGLNQTPMIVHSGKGDTIVDLDGNHFIDYCCSWGALIHGHAHPSIVQAVQRRMALGSSFGITTEIETLLAEKMVQLISSLEKVRFVSSGTEATMSAIRLARGFTKRDLIVKFSGHYHGHSDSLLVQAGSGVASLLAASSAGVPMDFVRNTVCLPFNDFDSLKTLSTRVAAVILEPIAANMGLVPPKAGFLETLREITQRLGILLIFDEVITGFRVSIGGGALFYDVEPDLLCFGKIIGGGFPVAAFGGKREIMDFLAPLGSVYQAGTLSGNPVAMEAGFQSVSLCEESGFYERLKEKTDRLTAPIKTFIEKENLNCCLQQVGSLFTLFFGQKKVTCFEDVKKCEVLTYNRFFKTLYQKGIYVSPLQVEANFVSSVHTEASLALTRDAILEFLEEGRRDKLF